jgi:hypothetical protein
MQRPKGLKLHPTGLWRSDREDSLPGTLSPEASHASSCEKKPKKKYAFTLIIIKSDL